MKTKVVWMYYKTDGDSGCYGIRLFSSQKKAKAYEEEKKDAYGRITKIEVH